MNLSDLQKKVAEILVENVDWDDIAQRIADGIEDDFSQELADKIAEDISTDDIVAEIANTL